VEDDQTGLLVPARDAIALANGILRLATDGKLREAMGEAGRKRLATHFSAEAVIRKTDALYQSLLPDATAVRSAKASKPQPASMEAWAKS
jgi:glycosyltransferase involved in cell wall biosynthesis